MATDKRKKDHPLFKGLPAHVLRLRQKAETDRREKERREFKARNLKEAK